jgi:hypothetical protein
MGIDFPVKMIAHTWLPRSFAETGQKAKAEYVWAKYAVACYHMNL